MRARKGAVGFILGVGVCSARVLEAKKIDIQSGGSLAVDLRREREMWRLGQGMYDVPSS